MSSKPTNPTTRPMRRTRRRQISQKRVCRSPKSSRAVVNGGSARSCSSVPDKLEALKNLIPAKNGDGDLKADELFKETADYIVLLRTQVLILQRLVDLYGSSQNQNAVNS